MRSKRKQKRQKKLQDKVTKGLLDLFSTNNPELVEREEEEQMYHQDMCPCCIDRANQIQLNKLEREYLDWTGKTDKVEDS